MIIFCMKSPLYIYFLSFLFFNKVVIPQKSEFLLWFFRIFAVVLYDVFLSLSCAACGLCRLSTSIWFSSFYYYGVFWCVGDFNGKTNSIKTSS